MRILMLFDLASPPPVDQDYADDLKSQTDEWESEAAVWRALKQLGHEVRPFGICDNIQILLDGLRDYEGFAPELVFNLAEAFRGDRTFESNIAAVLELAGMPFTGGSSRVLSICKDKSLAGRLVAQQGVRVPRSEVVRRVGTPLSVLKKISYPAFVKPIGLESSVGISQDSFVENEKDCRARVGFVHESLNQDALVEEYIEGRELYVSLMAKSDDGAMEIFPARELFFESVPIGDPKFATFKAKWDDNYRKKWGIRNGAARGLSDEIQDRITDVGRLVCRALGLSGYVRLDLRLTIEGELVFLEANPNPSLAPKDDFAQAALKAGYSYEKLISRILKFAGA